MPKAAVGIRGISEMQRRIQSVATKFRDQVAQAQYAETEIETAEAKRRTPVDTGALRSTVHTEGPNKSGNRIVTAIVAGGPAAPYALEVHENLYAFHKVGQAKYIESVILESRPFLADRIARRLSLDKMVV